MDHPYPGPGLTVNQKVKDYYIYTLALLAWGRENKLQK